MRLRSGCCAELRQHLVLADDKKDDARKAFQGRGPSSTGRRPTARSPSPPRRWCSRASLSLHHVCSPLSSREVAMCCLVREPGAGCPGFLRSPGGLPIPAQVRTPARLTSHSRHLPDRPPPDPRPRLARDRDPQPRARHSTPPTPGGSPTRPSATAAPWAARNAPFTPAYTFPARQRHAEPEQRRRRIPQRVHLALEHRRQPHEQPLHRPPTPVQLGHHRRDATSAGRLVSDLDHPVPVPGRVVQRQPHPPDRQLGPVPPGSVSQIVCSASVPVSVRPDRLPLRLPLPRQGRGVPADHEEPLPPGDPEQEPGGAEVPVRDPHVTRRRPSPGSGPAGTAPGRARPRSRPRRWPTRGPGRGPPGSAPGSGPATTSRSGLSRRWVWPRWLPSSTFTRYPGAGPGRPAHRPDDRPEPVGGVPDEVPPGVGAEPGPGGRTRR